MRVFFKILPYLLVVVLGVALYCGFKHMSNKLEQAQAQSILLQNEKASLENRLTSLTDLSNITIEQLKNIQNNEKQSLEFIGENDRKIESFKYNEDKEIILQKINAYEECMAKNSLKPFIKCELEL